MFVKRQTQNTQTHTHVLFLSTLVETFFFLNVCYYYHDHLSFSDVRDARPTNRKKSSADYVYIVMYLCKYAP